MKPQHWRRRRRRRNGGFHRNLHLFTEHRLRSCRSVSSSFVFTSPALSLFYVLLPQSFFFFFFVWRLMLTLLNPGLKIHLFTEQICKTFCDVTVTPRERRSRIWRFCNFTDFQVKLFWSYLSYVMKDKLNFTIYFEKKSLEESSKQRSTTRRRLARSSVNWILFLLPKYLAIAPTGGVGDKETPY